MLFRSQLQSRLKTHRDLGRLGGWAEGELGAGGQCVQEGARRTDRTPAAVVALSDMEERLGWTGAQQGRDCASTRFPLVENYNVALKNVCLTQSTHPFAPAAAAVPASDARTDSPLDTHRH